MIVDEFLNTLLECLAKANPMYAAIAIGVWFIFGDRIKAALAKLPWPKKTDVAADPLLTLLVERLKKKFAEDIATGTDPHDAYVRAVEALKK